MSQVIAPTPAKITKVRLICNPPKAILIRMICNPPKDVLNLAENKKLRKKKQIKKKKAKNK
ncbi:hypothetical protein RMATCC62417_14309 [Rhizopus microsporus]|nr:hypothetical protein RMATCC62417_14309 [Rhizopus microsporus]